MRLWRSLNLPSKTRSQSQSQQSTCKDLKSKWPKPSHLDLRPLTLRLLNAPAHALHYKTKAQTLCLSFWSLGSTFGGWSYIKPMTWKTTPTTNRPRMIMIGETFFFSNHMQNKVSSKPIKPGIKLSKLSCKVVTLFLVSDKPWDCNSKAFWTPAFPLGNELQSM